MRKTIFKRIKLISGPYEIEIGEDLNDYVLDEEGLDLGTVDGSFNTTQYIDLIGSHLDSTALLPRNLNIVGWIIGDSTDDIESKKHKLNRGINPLRDVRLEYKLYALDFRPDSSINYSKSYIENNEYMCKFQIQGTAHKPLFKLKQETEYRESLKKTKAFRFPFAIPKGRKIVFGYTPFSNVYNLYNQGDIKSGVTFIFHFLPSEEHQLTTADIPVIYNDTTGSKIEINEDVKMRLGDRVEICTELGNQFVRLYSGDSVKSLLSKVTRDSNLGMTLEQGTNTISYLSRDNLINEFRIEARFTPRFLEVEGF